MASSGLNLRTRTDDVIDAATLTNLWDQHADRLLLIVRSMGDSAEDAVQEAFIALARQSSLPADPLAWLVTVARNHQREHHRRNQRRRKRETKVSRHDWFDREVNVVDSRIDARSVTEALMRLDSPTREIIVMRVWGEMTFEAISEIVDLSRATVHREFHRGLEHLQQTFAPESCNDATRLCHDR